MKVVSSLSDATDALAGKGCVLSIGNFDGLHLGHQAILQTVVRRARELGVPAVAMTFEPHPIQVLAPESAPKRIHTSEQKIRRIAESGIDLLLTVKFDREFANLSPEQFVRQFLLDGLRIRAICVGSNFNFGHRQEGTIETLRQWAHAFERIEVPAVIVRGLPASSTQVRRAMLDGSVSRAARLLGRWFEIEGDIVSGAGRGRQVTVPTLNLDSRNELLPQRGVYVTRISLDRGADLDSVTNVGTRPTFDEGALSIETFVLQGLLPPDAATGRLQFLHRIRNERRFDSPGLLAEQIGRDVRQAAKFFRLLETIRHARAHSN